MKVRISAVQSRSIFSEDEYLIADCEKSRLHCLRTHYYDDDVLSPSVEESQVYYCKPSQSHDRRPETYEYLTKKQPDALNYTYYLKGFDTFRNEDERVKNTPHGY